MHATAGTHAASALNLDYRYVRRHVAATVLLLHFIKHFSEC